MPRVSPRRANGAAQINTKLSPRFKVDTTPKPFVSPANVSPPPIDSSTSSPRSSSPVDLGHYDADVHGSYMDYVKAKRQRNER